MPDRRETAAAAPTRYVQVGPDRIGYRSIGAGPPLLLLTRMRGTLDTWDPLFLDELAKTHRAITVDYPGVGYSSGTLPAGIGAAADFVAALATALELDRFVLLGWSWGGTVAQTFVVEHPSRAMHAILLGTNPPGELVKGIQPAFIERAFRPVNDLDDETVLFFEPRSAVSRAAARASRERIYARPGVADKIPSTQAEIGAYLAAAADY